MFHDLRELWGSRELVLMLVRRDLRVRYKNSVLGFFWSLIPLLLQTFVISVVVRRIYNVGPRDLNAYVLCAYIPWNFMQAGLLDGTASVLRQYPLLKKVYFPREVLPIASALANAVHLLLAVGVFFVYRYAFTPLAFGWPGWPPARLSGCLAGPDRLPDGAWRDVLHRVLERLPRGRCSSCRARSTWRSSPCPSRGSPSSSSCRGASLRRCTTR